MPQSTLATATNTLKVVYTTPNMYKAFKHRQVLGSMLDRKPQAVTQGLEFKVNVHTGGGAGGGNVAENGDDPAPDPQSNAWLTFNMKTYERLVRLTGQLIESTATSQAAVKRAVAFETGGAIKDARKDFGINLYRPANGEICRCRRGVSTTQFYVDNTSRLRVGQKICVAQRGKAQGSQIVTDGIGASEEYVRVINISPTGLVTVGQAVTSKNYTDTSAETALDGTPQTQWTYDAYYNANYSVYDWHDFDTAGGLNIFGLEDIILDSNPTGIGANYYGQVNRDTAGNEFAKGHVFDLEGNILTDDIAEEFADVVSAFSGGEVKAWVCDPRVYRQIKKLGGHKQATMKTKMSNQWFESVMLAGKPVIPDHLCTARTVYGLDTDAINIRENKAFAWINMDGSMWRKVASKWAWEAMGVRMWQLFAVPSSHCRISNCGYDSFTEDTERMAA